MTAVPGPGPAGVDVEVTDVVVHEPVQWEVVPVRPVVVRDTQVVEVVVLRSTPAMLGTLRASGKSRVVRLTHRYGSLDGGSEGRGDSESDRVVPESRREGRGYPFLPSPNPQGGPSITSVVSQTRHVSPSAYTLGSDAPLRPSLRVP